MRMDYKFVNFLNEIVNSILIMNTSVTFTMIPSWYAAEISFHLFCFVCNFLVP